MIDFTDIFGSDIIVGDQPTESRRNYTAHAGSHGLTDMWMGTSGYPIVVRGRLAANGADYATARANLRFIINGIDAMQWELEKDYRHMGIEYYNVVFDKFQLVKDRNGKIYKMVKGGWVVADFVMMMRSLG